MQLFGVQPIGEPAHQLRSVLSRLPKYSKVGVGFLHESAFDELKGRFLEGIPLEASLSIDFNDSQPRYWQKLVSGISDQEIIYLDNYDTHKKYFELVAKQKIEEDKNNTALVNALVAQKGIDGIVSMTFNEFQSRAQTMKTIVADREAKLIEKLGKLPLDAAVLEINHADNFASYARNLQRYMAEIFTTGSRQKFLEDRNPDKRFQNETSSILRDYELATRGFFTTTPPDFVGCFDTWNPINSYFEMFIDGEGKGTIIDSLGFAKFEFTTFTDSKIVFKKEYYAPVREGHTNPIYNSLSREGKLFRGKYKLLDQKGDVVMSEAGGVNSFIKLLDEDPEISKNVFYSRVGRIEPRIFCSKRGYHTISQEENDPLICHHCDAWFGKNDGTEYEVIND